MIAAYREPDRTRGRDLMTKLIDSVSHEVPTLLSEIVTLGRTLKRRADDVLAYFERPGTSNGPTPTIAQEPLNRQPMVPTSPTSHTQEPPINHQH
jgi:transposase